MTMQAVAVAIIVPLCALVAVWNLIGAQARRHVATWLVRMPWPAAWARRLVNLDAAASACGCAGCDRAEGTGAAPPLQSVVRLQRRIP
jgi:hypothetical protein